MQHLSKSLAKCAVCGESEPTAGTFPFIVGVGRVCMNCGMKKVRCELCGNEVKLLTSARLQGKTLCLADYTKEIEKFRKNLLVTYDEDREPTTSILARAQTEAPEGYILLAVRRARNSTHIWEAEYEKTELYQMRCS